MLLICDRFDLNQASGAAQRAAPTWHSPMGCSSLRCRSAPALIHPVTHSSWNCSHRRPIWVGREHIPHFPNYKEHRMRTIRTAALAAAAAAALAFGAGALAQEAQKPAPVAEKKAPGHKHGERGGHGCGGMHGGGQEHKHS